MKFNLTIILLLLSLICFSQNDLLQDIDTYAKHIDSRSDLNLEKYDWNKVTKSQTDNIATLKIWKKGNQIVKTEEQFETTNGKISRFIYLKNNKPIKGIEKEEVFNPTPSEAAQSNQKLPYQLQVYVTGFNDEIKEYEFEMSEEGERYFTEPYCDLNSLFVILDEIGNL
ncbi:hypothetical protein [Aestuariibaculum sediminum]|uniref:Uncharacterized protein n=1 Tax=Aestuariibaculum sediminum TaxID=2770637 RepID=A0A8J6PYL2_9FLAO|nr:hypothetical protein [Aestuariibaculum sediminum]MBD0831098.1 hypothetical protein [Aestuariibaculum sediminum]